MATINDWNKYINAVHELALVEYDLRAALVSYRGSAGALDLAEQILYERF